MKCHVRRGTLKYASTALLLCCSAVWGSDVRDVRGYEVQDSGFIGRSGIAEDVYWLDHDRVIFVGAKSGDYVEPNVGMRFPNYGLYVWDTRVGSVRLHHKGSLYSNLCVFRGYVRFELDSNGSRYVFEGQFGKELLTPVDKEVLEQRSRRERVVNPYTCREYRRSELPGLGHRVSPLLDGEYSSQDREPRAAEVVHWTYWPRNGVPVQLNMTPHPAGVGRYSEYLDSYVLNEAPPGVTFSDTVIRRSWLMDRQGRVRDFTPPAGPWMRGTTYVVPTKRGLFLISHAIGSRGGNGAAGGFLMDEAGLYRVIEGRPESFDISHDGCRVAVSISDRARANANERRIKVLNLCSKGG